MESTLPNGGFEQCLTIEEIVAQTRIGKKDTILRLLKSGELKGAKIGRRWKVRPSDLKTFIELKFGDQKKEQAD